MKSALIAAGLLTAANGGTAVEDPLQVKQRCVIEIHDGDHADHEAGDHNHHVRGAFFVDGVGEDGSPTWLTEDKFRSNRDVRAKISR